MNNDKKVKNFIKILKNLYPNPKIELDYESDFQLLIAIIMSAQATDKQVNKVNKTFFTKFKNPKDLFDLWQDFIKNEIKSIGLYNSKSKNIFQTSKLLTLNYNWLIPNNLDELQKLPWVWIKTAKVFLIVTKNMPYLAVDTHVHRVLNRWWFVNTKTPLQTDKEALNIFTKKDILWLHHRLVLFGRYYCTAKKHKCEIDPILKDFCPYKEKNT